MTSVAKKDDPAHGLMGRCFIHPLFDYVLIGGGLSLLVTAIVLIHPRGAGFIGLEDLPWIFLLSNSTHFASSSVRLYTKPGAYQSLRFLTMGLPLTSLLVVTLCIAFAGQLGPHLRALYFTWSPYHYAAQAYGLAVVYSFRSGCALSGGQKNALWWTSMVPFLFVFMMGKSTGLGWLVPDALLGVSWVPPARQVTGLLLTVATVVAPLWLFFSVRRSGGPMPLIVLLLLFSNAIWWFVLASIDAFAWATIFHGLQYLAIVIIFHLKDHMAAPDNRHGTVYHVLTFYGASLLLAYGLFHCLPLAYVFFGFGRVESMLLVVAAINIHHFIVDAYIWRLKPGDRNRQIVEDRVPVPAF